METLGGRLCYARKKNGYTQESLAEAIGVSRGEMCIRDRDRISSENLLLSNC